MGYEKSQIYIIINDQGLSYIGSTIQGYKVRLGKHQSDFRGHMEDSRIYRAYRSSFDVLQHGEHNIYLIENYPCCNVKELETREVQWILKMNDLCILTNKKLPLLLTDEEIEASEALELPTDIKELLCID